MPVREFVELSGTGGVVFAGLELLALIVAIRTFSKTRTARVPASFGTIMNPIPRRYL